MLNQTNLSENRLPDVRNLSRGCLWDIGRAKVYFMSAAGLIKIGVTADVDVRWRSLNNSSPVPIDLLGFYPGTQSDERELHARFKHLRVRGEWFSDTPELRELILEKCGEIWTPQSTLHP